MNSRNSETYDYKYSRNKENKHIYDIGVQSKKEVDLDNQKRDSDRLISKMETLDEEIKGFIEDYLLIWIASY